MSNFLREKLEECTFVIMCKSINSPFVGLMCKSGQMPIVHVKGKLKVVPYIRDVCRGKIVEDSVVTRMLYHTAEEGECIPPELYQVVAEVYARMLSGSKH